jgi:hypothetical protein
MTLLLLILRRVNNTLAKKDEAAAKEMSKAFLSQYHQDLVKILFKIPKTAEYDEEAAKYFLIIEEILLSLKHAGYFETYGLEFLE